MKAISRLMPRRNAALYALCATLSVLISACTPAWLTPLERDNPLVGRVWDTRARQFVSPDAALARASGARIVILGETHDNADHHRLQSMVLAALLRSGRRPLLAMEQFDREHQAGLDAARARGERDPEQIADAGRFDRRGWKWPDYRPLVEFAVGAGLDLRAANLSRENARTLMRTGAPAAGLPPAPAALRAALEQDIIDGHCGHRPAAAMLAGMVEAQRARDAQMATSLNSAGPDGAVLIAGAGHARRDRGVPEYLPAAARSQVLSIGFIEVVAQKNEPHDYVGNPASETGPEYDLVWFTPRAEREDPCKNFRLR